MIETVDGSEAARLFAEYVGLGRGARGLTFIKELALHFSRLPYENISKILKSARAGTVEEALRLPAEVVADHIHKSFGGTCFSLTFLFERMLRSFGFECYKVMADMRAGRNLHCLTVVVEPAARAPRGLGSKYMIDPGYTLYEVIRLPTDGAEEVACPHAMVEVARGLDGRYSVSTDDATGRKWRYSFADVPVPEPDFERHWIESFGKPTLNNICLTRMTPRGHIYFRKDFFKFTARTGVEKRRLKEGVERLIEEEFGIRGEWVEAAQRLLNARRQTWRKWPDPNRSK